MRHPEKSWTGIKRKKLDHNLRGHYKHPLTQRNSTVGAQNHSGCTAARKKQMGERYVVKIWMSMALVAGQLKYTAKFDLSSRPTCLSLCAHCQLTVMCSAPQMLGWFLYFSHSDLRHAKSTYSSKMLGFCPIIGPNIVQMEMLLASTNGVINKVNGY